MPLLIGLGIIAIAWREVPKGAAMNRQLFGSALIAGGLLWWVSTAILLTQHQGSFFLLNLFPLPILFVGIAYFFPTDHARPNHASALATMFARIGVSLGFAHSLALSFTQWWPAHLIQFYSSLGFHGTPVTP